MKLVAGLDDLAMILSAVVSPEAVPVRESCTPLPPSYGTITLATPDPTVILVPSPAFGVGIRGAQRI
jgi:hypothetical protein